MCRVLFGFNSVACVIFPQSMDALDLQQFRYGGVNLTGFRLVDQGSRAVRAVRRLARVPAEGGDHGGGFGEYLSVCLAK